jgi:hypothetical protein
MFAGNGKSFFGINIPPSVCIAVPGTNTIFGDNGARCCSIPKILARVANSLGLKV